MYYGDYPVKDEGGLSVGRVLPIGCVQASYANIQHYGPGVNKILLAPGHAEGIRLLSFFTSCFAECRSDASLI